MSAAVITVAPIGASAGSVAKRDAVITIGASIVSELTCANAEEENTAAMASAIASGVVAIAACRETGEVMMCFQKGSNQPTSPWAGLNRNARTESRQSKRTMRSDDACVIHIVKNIGRSISTCPGRYPGWQGKLPDLPMQMHSGIERQPVAEGRRLRTVAGAAHAD